jgi:hypothetical protein
MFQVKELKKWPHTTIDLHALLWKLMLSNKAIFPAFGSSFWFRAPLACFSITPAIIACYSAATTLLLLILNDQIPSTKWFITHGTCSVRARIFQLRCLCSIESNNHSPLSLCGSRTNPFQWGVSCFGLQELDVHFQFLMMIWFQVDAVIIPTSCLKRKILLSNYQLRLQ